MHGGKRRLGLAAGGILVLVLSGCGGDTGAGATPSAVAKDHLKILVGGMSKQIYLPNMLTKQLGYFDEQNLDVELIDEASGQSAEEEVLSGGVEAGSGSYNHTIEIQAKGKGLTEVVQLLISPGEAEMVSSKEADTVKSITDLKGKNLGVTELGSGTHTLTQYMLGQKGITAGSGPVRARGRGRHVHRRHQAGQDRRGHDDRADHLSAAPIGRRQGADRPAHAGRDPRRAGRRLPLYLRVHEVRLRQQPQGRGAAAGERLREDAQVDPLAHAGGSGRQDARGLLCGQQGPLHHRAHEPVRDVQPRRH